MVAKRYRYLPIQVSERLDPPLTLCRAVAVAVAGMLMTNGESVIHPNGRIWNTEALRAHLKLARMKTGQPKRPGYNQSHVRAFLEAFNGPNIAQKDFVFNKTKLRIRKALQHGHAITFAGNVGRTPRGSKLRRDVNNVAHEMIFWDWDGGDRTGTVLFIDGMTPQGSNSFIRRVPVSHMWAFASAYKSNNVYIAERWKIGDYTAARQQEKSTAKLVLSIQDGVSRLYKLTRALDAENAKLVAKYNDLEASIKRDGGVPLLAERQALALMREAISKLDVDHEPS